MKDLTIFEKKRAQIDALESIVGMLEAKAKEYDEKCNEAMRKFDTIEAASAVMGLSDFDTEEKDRVEKLARTYRAMRLYTQDIIIELTARAEK